MTSHPAHGKAHGQIREHLLLAVLAVLAVLAGGALGPVCSTPMLRYGMVDLRHRDAAGR